MATFITLNEISEQSLNDVYTQVKDYISYDGFVNIRNVLINSNTQTVNVTCVDKQNKSRSLVIVNSTGEPHSQVSISLMSNQTSYMEVDNLVLKGKSKGMVNNNGKTQFFVSDAQSNITVSGNTTINNQEYQYKNKPKPTISRWVFPLIVVCGVYYTIKWCW